MRKNDNVVQFPKKLTFAIQTRSLRHEKPSKQRELQIPNFNTSELQIRWNWINGNEYYGEFTVTD